MPIQVSPERFEELVIDALDGIPPALATHMDNVAVFIEDHSPEIGLLGLYEGIPLTEREDYGIGGGMPDTITIFRDSICRICGDEDEVIHQVTVTVVHEIAHHFGIDDARLHELGWA